MTPADLVRRRRVLVCLGGGGVGKTTIAAALALGAARAGRRALVLTIDPARRLANALGLATLGDAPQPVAGVPGLEAMMLDQKRALDRLVARHAPSAEARDRLLANRLYRGLSGAFAGTHAYLALEELAALAAGGRHDLLVVDTPPIDHVFEFLEGPSRLAALLDRRLLRWLVGAARPLGETARYLVHQLAFATGAGALSEAADFFALVNGMAAGLRARAAHARRLLADPATALLLIGRPDSDGAAEVVRARERLAHVGLGAIGLLLNRVHPPLPHVPDDPAAIAAALSEAGVRGHVAWIAANALAHRRLAAEHGRWAAELGADAVVPLLRADVADLGALAALADRLAV